MRNRPTKSLAGLVVSTLVLLGGAPADDEIIYVVEEGTLQAAISKCNQGTSPGTRDGCRIILPRGDLNVGEIVIGGLTNLETTSGVILQGHGAGQIFASPSGGSNCGTTLSYTGSAGGTMLTLIGVRNAQIRDVCLHGKGNAGIGIEIIAKNSASVISGRTAIDQVAVSHFTDTGIRIAGCEGGGCDPSIGQADLIGIRHTHLAHMPTCVRQESRNSVSNSIELSNCAPSGHGIDLVRGALAIRDSNCSIGDLGAAADANSCVRVHSSAYACDIRGNDFEVDDGVPVTTTGPVDHDVACSLTANMLNAGEHDAGQEARLVYWTLRGTLFMAGNRHGRRGGIPSAWIRIDGPSSSEVVFDFNDRAGGGIHLHTGANVNPPPSWP